jgi:hypothetical protein
MGKLPVREKFFYMSTATSPGRGNVDLRPQFLQFSPISDGRCTLAIMESTVIPAGITEKKRNRSRRKIFY